MTLCDQGETVQSQGETVQSPLGVINQAQSQAIGIPRSVDPGRRCTYFADEPSTRARDRIARLGITRANCQDSIFVLGARIVLTLAEADVDVEVRLGGLYVVRVVPEILEPHAMCRGVRRARIEGVAQHAGAGLGRLARSEEVAELTLAAETLGVVELVVAATENTKQAISQKHQKHQFVVRVACVITQTRLSRLSRTMTESASRTTARALRSRPRKGSR